MNPEIWGSAAWDYLGLVTQAYNKNDQNQKNYIKFFKLLGDVLPCKLCQQSYKKFYQEIPIQDYLTDSESLSYWLYLIHNKVSNKLRKQGKTIKQPNFQTVDQKYVKKYEQQSILF